MARSGLILIQDGKIALIRRVREGILYYAIPGGGVEEDESFEQACLREAMEELGVEVRIDCLAAITIHENNEQRYYLCTQTGGVFGTGEGEEYNKPADMLHRGTHEPVWIPIGSLGGISVYPRCIADLVMACHSTSQWDNLPRRFRELADGYEEDVKKI